MKKTLSTLIVIATIAIMALPFFTTQLVAKADVGNLWGNSSIQTTIQANTGLGNKDPRVIVGDIIKIALGFLGIIAVLMILIAGFQWMTAGGDPKKVEEATTRLKAAVIGLIIILAAYALANFIINNAYIATNT